MQFSIPQCHSNVFGVTFRIKNWNNFIISIQILEKNHVFHCVSSSTRKETFIFYMLWVWRHVILPHNAIRSDVLTFAPPNMFLQRLLNLGTKSFYLPLICAHIWHLVKCIFLLKPRTTSSHGSFTTQLSWKTWFISSIPSFFFSIPTIKIASSVGFRFNNIPTTQCS